MGVIIPIGVSRGSGKNRAIVTDPMDSFLNPIIHRVYEVGHLDFLKYLAQSIHLHTP